MENATKALEIAASVLIGVLLLGALIFGYNQIAEQKKIEQKNEKARQLSEYNINFESYSKDKVYGSELLSLANEIINYNTRKATDESGYQKIELEVTIKNAIIDGKVFKFDNKTYSANDIDDAYKDLSKKIREANVQYAGKSVAYWTNALPVTSEAIFRQKILEYGYNIPDSQKSELFNKIIVYKQLVNEQKEFGRKTFKYKDLVEYDQGNGRVVKLTFEEK